MKNNTFNTRVQTRVDRLPANIRKNQITVEAVVRGLRAEDLFVQCATDCGWSVSQSTNQQDRVEHWDFWLHSRKYMQKYRVEVKSIKKISRWDENPQDKLIWVEIHGKQSYNDGWLNGKADLIAFEMRRKFVLVKRTDLFKLVQKNLSLKVVTSPYNAKYNRYQPKGETVLTLVPKKDIVDIAFLEFPKEKTQITTTQQQIKNLM